MLRACQEIDIGTDLCFQKREACGPAFGVHRAVATVVVGDGGSGAGLRRHRRGGRATGLSPATISRGLRELESDAPLAGDRVRPARAGRKRATTHHPTLLRDLEALVEPTAPGDRTRRCGGF